MVANGHLERQAAQVELQLGDLLGQFTTPTLECRRRGCRRRAEGLPPRTDAIPQTHSKVSLSDPAPAGFESLGGALPGVTTVLGSLADFF